MKKILLSVFSVIVFIQTAQAEKVPMKGQIIYENDTVDAIFMIPFSEVVGEINFVRLQHGIVYLDSRYKMVRIKPNQAKEIRFKYDSITYRMVSVNNSTDQFVSLRANIFLRLTIDGSLKLFAYYHYGDNAMHTCTSNYFLKKSDTPFMQNNLFSFHSDMMMYLSDCSILVDKLKNKEFKDDDLVDIVLFYNNSCGKSSF